MSAPAAPDSFFDVDPDAWYASKSDGERSRSTRINVIRPDGKAQTAEINATRDIAAFMFSAGLIKDDSAARAAVARKQSPPVVSSVKLGNQAVVSAPDDFEQELDAIIGEGHVPIVASAPVETRKEVSSAKVKEKRTTDFKSIKLDWLKDKPGEPILRAKFTSEHGDFETYYHAMIPSEAVVYLIFDTRCKFGRFMPKMDGILMHLSIGNSTFNCSGVLWSAAKFDLGVLEITPFIIAKEAVEAPSPAITPAQPPKKDQARIPDYDWNFGSID